MNVLFVVSGGDAPGINAALCAGAVLAEKYGDTAWGADGGFPGLLEGQLRPLNARDLLPWAAMAGTRLASSREPVLATDAGRTRLARILGERQIDAIVLFGGDGTLRYIPPILSDMNVACIGLPTTIDNDVPGTDYTLGFDSACNFAYHAIDGIRATGGALPGRIFTLETLGGHTGFLALEIARGAGADAALVPEYEYDAVQTAARLLAGIQSRGQALLVYSEGLPGKSDLLARIPELTGIRVRSTALGHAQRGGVPTHRDRATAAAMIEAAFGALKDGLRTGTAVVRGERITVVEGMLPASEPKLPDRALYDRINGIV